MCFQEIENTIRTDENFKHRTYKNHHNHTDVALEKLNIGCVTQFPIDYMHCVLLGVTRQLLFCLIKQRKKEFSLKNSEIMEINKNLKCIQKCLPAEFQRKQRTLKEIEHWKATEFIMFLCYTGMFTLNKNT